MSPRHWSPIHFMGSSLWPWRIFRVPQEGQEGHIFVDLLFFVQLFEWLSSLSVACWVLGLYGFCLRFLALAFAAFWLLGFLPVVFFL